MTRVLKSREDDIDKIEALFADAEKQLSRDFLARVNQLKSDANIERIRVFLEQGRVDLALEALDEEDDSNFLLILFNTWILASTLQIALTRQSIQALQVKLFGAASPVVFDPTDTDNARLIKELQLRIQANLNDTKRKTFLYIVNDGFVNGLEPKDIMLRVQKFVGLTVKQIEAVLNYEKLLRANSKQALDRALRDKSGDRRVANDKPLTEKQIQNLVDSYVRNQLRYRAEVIGRTIAGDLINEAFQNAAKKAVGDAGLELSSITKTWRSRRDKKVRFTHSVHGGMDGQTVEIDDYFISPSGAILKHPHDSSAPIKEIAGCRCIMTVNFKQNS